MNINNCTPHALHLRRIDGTFLDLPKGITVPRLTTTKSTVVEINGLQVTRQVFGDVAGLPDQEPGTILIVSRMVKDACPERTDLYCPGELIRDPDGAVIGADGLSI